jgi:hypothetical protein
MENGLSALISAAREQNTAEITMNGIRILVRVPTEVPPVNPDGTCDVSFDVLDVLEPPAAREKWLQFLKDLHGTNT